MVNKVLVMAAIIVGSLFFIRVVHDDIVFASENTIACELLTLCREAASLYYHEEISLPTMPEEHRMVTHLRASKNELIGFITETPSGIFVVFRGTQNLLDVKRNLDCVKTPFSSVPCSGHVHRGFFTTYTKTARNGDASLRQSVMDAICNMDSEKELYITGHSMGGGLATMCALDVATSYPKKFKNIIVYTFASPRVGDRAFVERYNAAVHTTIRIRNRDDVIPLVPFRCMGYRHVKGRIFINVKAKSLKRRHQICTGYFPGIFFASTKNKK